MSQSLKIPTCSTHLPCAYTCSKPLQILCPISREGSSEVHVSGGNTPSQASKTCPVLKVPPDVALTTLTLICLPYVVHQVLKQKLKTGTLTIMVYSEAFYKFQHNCQHHCYQGSIILDLSYNISDSFLKNNIITNSSHACSLKGHRDNAGTSWLFTNTSRKIFMHSLAVLSCWHVEGSKELVGGE